MHFFEFASKNSVRKKNNLTIRGDYAKLKFQNLYKKKNISTLASESEPFYVKNWSQSYLIDTLSIGFNIGGVQS